ncbi:type II secretion system F family protein [Romboutsia sp.]|uniref:type II secretion system F family protein n=1 Tax=Romboutsia sp. TaxID=1965302 RepID=UPI002D10B4AF|nr:type II secretion system F family protein [Romboutsia sp.]HSQ88645.1 type II secretion system F family protein [Romboutsia sp.]
MKNYKYTALMLNGKKTKGIISANDFNDARHRLKEKKIRPLEIKEHKQNSLFENKNSNKKLKSDTISHFCRQYAIIISSGINSITGLESLAKRAENKVLSVEITRIVNDIKSGSTLADSMLDDKSKFPKLLSAMVATGEATGTLEEVLKSMATFYEREHRTTQKIKNASTYPTLVAILSFIMLFIFTSFIMPQMMESIIQVGAQMPLISQLIMNIGMFMKNYWYLVLTGIIVGFLLLKQYIKTPIGRHNKDVLINKIPLLGKGMNAIVSMRFSKALYLFVSTGYPLLQGLNYIKESLNNSIAEKSVQDAKDGIIRGETIADNLEKSGYFDPVLIQMLSIGEQTGQLETISNQMSEFYEHEAEIYLNRIVSMIEPIMIVLVGIMVAFLVIGVFLPMLSIYDAI